MKMSKEKVIIELLMAILKGINLLVIKTSLYEKLKNDYTKYANSTIKLAERYLENE